MEKSEIKKVLAEEEEKQRLYQTNPGHTTLLMRAAYYADIPLLQQILECTPDVNAQDWYGHTAVMFPILAKNNVFGAKSIALLLEAGADLTHKNRYAQDAFGVARQQHATDILQAGIALYIDRNPDAISELYETLPHEGQKCVSDSMSARIKQLQAWEKQHKR